MNPYILNFVSGVVFHFYARRSATKYNECNCYALVWFA
jgi:hypothetical protein